ncbi:unnamed protein product [Auanema sp. JU1783]|nr:unnamed protein product [Auanema sp. JU1783]
METKRLLFFTSVLLLSYLSSAANQLDNLELGNAQHFNLDKVRLRELWHTAMIRGLIKAKTRSYLEELPVVERILFQQCENDAKNTVDLAKCSWKVIKLRRFHQLHVKTDSRKNENRKIEKLNFYNTNEVKQPLVYSTSQVNTSNYTTNYKMKSIKYGFRNGKPFNPIRPQIRRYKNIPRPRRQSDPISDAWELFLKEERHKMKQQMKVDKKSLNVTTLPASLDRNFLGLPRKFKKSKRNKRNLLEPDPLKPIVAEKQTSNDMGLYLNKLFKKSATPNLKKLQVLKDHFEKVEEIKEYYKTMNVENKDLFKKLGIPVDSQEPQLQDNVLAAVEDLMGILNDFSATKGLKTLSIMSPRLFPIFPEKRFQTKRRLLSPTLLSFHKEGFFSLPDVFDVLTSEKSYQQMMLDLLMDLSGAGKALDQVLSKMSHEIEYVSNVQYPLLMEMKEHDLNWTKARKTFTTEQKIEYDKHGYTYLNPHQLNLVYNNPRFMIDHAPNITELSAMNRTEKEMRIEELIREIAEIDKEESNGYPPNSKRVKRVVDGVNTTGVSFLTLHPAAFSNIIGQGVALEAVTLSPHAFIGEIMMGEALNLHVLSPRAFIATVLSPSALIARILSPSALRAEVLAPRALTAWVLSPEAMIAEVLTPRFLEPRVLSPEALVIDILSPGILSPHILSSESIGVMVLSPNILSPRIASEEHLLVEVLSPHILGGPHNKEEKETNIHDKESSAASSSHEAGGANHGGHHRMGLIRAVQKLR